MAYRAGTRLAAPATTKTRDVAQIRTNGSDGSTPKSRLSITRPPLSAITRPIATPMVVGHRPCVTTSLVGACQRQ